MAPAASSQWSIHFLQCDQVPVPRTPYLRVISFSYLVNRPPPRVVPYSNGAIMLVPSPWALSARTLHGLACSLLVNPINKCFPSYKPINRLREAAELSWGHIPAVWLYRRPVSFQPCLPPFPTTQLLPAQAPRTSPTLTSHGYMPRVPIWEAKTTMSRISVQGHPGL